MQVSKPKKGYKLVDIGFGKFEEIPEEWNYEEFQTILKKDNIKKIKIKTAGYENQGKIPIIDQGQELICGYTDDSSLIYSGELPVIIFGDHTLVVKFIDFPFAVGADGTKIIQIDKEKGLTKFFYYSILNRNLESEGYKRHFSKLREQKFCYPIITEQQKIVSIISNVDNTLEKTNQLIQKIELLKKGLMQKLFTKGICHSKFKKVKWLFDQEIEIPEEWGIKNLDTLCTQIVDGPHVSPNYVENGIPFLTVNNIIDGFINLNNVRFIAKEDYEIFSKRAKPESGDIIYTKGGTTGIAKVIDVDFEFGIWVHLALLKVKN